MAQYENVVDEARVQQDDADGGTFTNAFARGTDNLQASLYAASNIIGELTGFDSLASWGEEGMLRNLDEAALNPAEVHSWDDVDSLADFGTYWLETLGEQAPQLLGDLAAGIAGGGIGGIVARRSAMSIAGKAAFGKALKRKTGEGALSNFKDKIKKVGGAGIGVGLSNVAQNAGETQTTLKGAGIDAPGTALTAGIVKGALDTIAPLQLLSIARKAGVPASTVPALIGGIAAKVGITTATESATEAVQTVVDHIAQRIHDPDFEMFGDEAMHEIREAAIKGGLVGGTLGGAVSTISDVSKFEHDPDGLGRILNEAMDERAPMLYTADDITKTVYDGWDSTKAFHLEQVGERQRIIDGVEVDFEAAAVTLANVEEEVAEDPTLVNAPTPDQLLLDIDGLMPNLEKLPLNFDENDDNVRDTLDGIDLTYGPETADKAYEWLDARKRVALDSQSEQITVDPDLVAVDTDALLGKARGGDVEAQEVLTSYGLSWEGDKPKYRMVSTAEADKVLAGERVESDREGDYTDITDNADYDKVGESDRRITFKKTGRFDSDREGEQALRQKNEAEGEYQLFGGYELDEVQSVEQRSEDGTWAPLYEATAPTTAVTSRDGVSVATGTTDREVAVQYKGRGRSTGTRRAEPSTPSKIEGTLSLPNKRGQDGPSTESRDTVAAGVSRTGDRVKLAPTEGVQDRQVRGVSKNTAPRPRTNLALMEQAIKEQFAPEVAKRLIKIARAQGKDASDENTDITRGGIQERKSVDKAKDDLQQAQANLAAAQDPNSSQEQLMELREQLRLSDDSPNNILTAAELRAKYNNQPLGSVVAGLEKEVAKKRAALAKAKKAAVAPKDATKQEQAYLARMMAKSSPKAVGSTSTAADRVAQLRVEDNKQLKESGYVDESGNIDIEMAQQDSMPADSTYERAGPSLDRDDSLTEGEDISGSIRVTMNKSRYAGKRGTVKEGTEWVLGDLEYRKYEDAANAAANLSGDEVGRYQVRTKDNNRAIYQIHEIIGWDTYDEALSYKEEFQNRDGTPVDPSVAEVGVVSRTKYYSVYAGKVTEQQKDGTQGQRGKEVANDTPLIIQVFSPTKDEDGNTTGLVETYRTEQLAGEIKEGLRQTLEEKTPEGGSYSVSSKKYFIEEFMLPDELASSPLKKVSNEIAPNRGGANSAVTNEEAVNLFIDGQNPQGIVQGKVQRRRNVQETLNARYEQTKSQANYQRKRDMDDSFVDFIDPNTGEVVSFIGTDLAELGQSVMTNEKTTSEFKSTEQFRYNSYTVGAALLHERGYKEHTAEGAPVRNPVVAGNRNHSTGKGYVLRLNSLAAADADMRASGTDYMQDALLSGDMDGMSYDAIGDQITAEQASRGRVRASRRIKVARAELVQALGESSTPIDTRVEMILGAQRELSVVNNQRIVMEDGQIVKLRELKGKDNTHVAESHKKTFTKLLSERDRLQGKMDTLIPAPPANLDAEQTGEYWRIVRNAVKTPASTMLRERTIRDRMKETQRRLAGKREGKDNVGGFRQQDLLEGQGIDNTGDDVVDVGWLRETDKDYGPDGTTRITERNREISTTSTQGDRPAPSVTADRRGETAPIDRSRVEYVQLPVQGEPSVVLHRDQGLVDANGVPLTRTTGYGNVGKGTVNFIDGILEAVDLKHIKMVVAHLKSLDDVFKAGHITLAQKVEIEKKFESNPDRQAVFIPRGDSGIIVTRNIKDKDLMLSVVGHEVGHGVLSGITHKIFRSVDGKEDSRTDREKALAARLQKAFHADVDDVNLPAYTKKTEGQFTEWFADKMSAYARGLAQSRTEKGKGLADKLYQSSAEKLREVFNKTKGQTSPRFHRNTKFENVIKEYVKDNVFANIRSIGYGKIESIILGPPITAQTASLSHAKLGQGVKFLGNLGRGEKSLIGSTPFRALFDVHNRMKMHGMQVVADMVYKETNSREQHTAYYNMLNNARAEFAAKLKKVFPQSETTANMNQIMEQLAKELPTGQLTPKAKAVRKMLGEFHRYMNDAGFPVEFDPLFFPRDYKLSAMEAHSQHFLDILTSESAPGASDALSLPQARAVLEGFLTPIDPNDAEGLLAKKLQAQYERKIPSSKMPALVEAGFATTDPVSALKRYIDKHTQYAEHYRAFGGFEYVQGYHTRETIEGYVADADKAAAYAKNRRLIEAKMKLHELWEKPTNSKFTQEQIDQYYSDSLTEAQKRGYVQDDGNGGHKWIHPDSQLRDRMQSLVYAYEQKHGAVAAAKWEKEANTLLEHALGQNSRPNRNGFIFNLIGEARAYESLRTLMFSGVASVPEIAVAFQRSKGEVGMVNFAKIVWDSVRNYDDAKEMAELMGFIQDDMASIIAMDMLSVHDGDGGVGRFFRKGIAPLMKYNGNEMIVNLSRVIAMKAGMHFLKSTARKALAAPAGSKEYQRATRYLQELGIDAATVMRWMDDVQYKGLKEASTQDGNSMHAADAAKVRAALNTFINESVMRPNAAERPTWADHPIGTFVYHLKTFAYSFGKRVVGGAIREINARRGEGISRFDALTESMVYALPALMVFTLFGAMSDELRNRIATLVGEGEWRGTWGANREDPLAMVGKWMSRSGLLTSAPFFDPVYDTLTGKPSVNSFAFGAGPLASHAWDLFKPSARGRTTDVMGVSVDKRILKSIPVVNQLPYLKGVNAMPPVRNKGVAGAVYDWALSFFKDAPGPRKLKGRFSGVVTQIEDGDTAFVRDAKGKIHHIRLFGIDTNEKGQRGGNDQTSALSDMVLGKRVVISDYGNGLFGRMLGVIQLNGVDINAKMLEEGKAWYSHTYAEDLPDDMKRLYVTALNNAYRGKKSQWDGRTQLDPQDYKRMMRRFEKIKKATAEAAKPSFWESLVGGGVSGGT